MSENHVFDRVSGLRREAFGVNLCGNHVFYSVSLWGCEETRLACKKCLGWSESTSTGQSIRRKPLNNKGSGFCVSQLRKARAICLWGTKARAEGEKKAKAMGRRPQQQEPVSGVNWASSPHS